MRICWVVLWWINLYIPLWLVYLFLMCCNLCSLGSFLLFLCWHNFLCNPFPFSCFGVYVWFRMWGIYSLRRSLACFFSVWVSLCRMTGYILYSNLKGFRVKFGVFSSESGLFNYCLVWYHDLWKTKKVCSSGAKHPVALSTHAWS